ncbi:Tudor domain-containing protein 3 [Quillaja saponaria]|uniref:Tudor domain-containing protein 3 n=1 Tax=Quillaja saponaria TaxID=32244 RepID=A0AAD7VKG8_QUISA|nr:Tudor domain-containing protein 3 [Quillaja saponaria]
MALKMEDSSTEAVLETLRKRGWFFGGTEQVKAMIVINSALADDSTAVLNLVESELLNADLRSIGGKSLPDTSLLGKTSYLQGPKILQISSVRDITKSTIEDFAETSSSRRLLRLGLTDGHTEITAVEYSHISSIPDNVIPGTKIRLENKAEIHSGIVCLNPKVLAVLGGVVQPLYEEWQMNQKYSGFSRSSLRVLQESDTGGPPPFQKLTSSDYAKWGPRSSRPTAAVMNTELRPTRRWENLDKKADNKDVILKTTLPAERAEEKPSSSGTRPKEVVESVPVQNQAAAQKLLQKMSQQSDHHPKGWRIRGKAKQEDPEVFTLDEYEDRKTQAKPLMNHGVSDINRDEDLAWQLQSQFDLEDSQISVFASCDGFVLHWSFHLRFLLSISKYPSYAVYATSSG